MGEIHTNGRDMWAVKWIEVRQLFKKPSHISIIWVSKVGIWGTDRDYRMIKRQNKLCLLVICRIIRRGKKWNPMSPTWITSYPVRMSKVRVKQNYISINNSEFCESLFQFLIYLLFLPRLEFSTAFCLLEFFFF